MAIPHLLTRGLGFALAARVQVQVVDAGAGLVDFVNTSLVRIGEATLVSLSDNTARARRARVVAVKLVDELLAGADWNFASRRVSLAQLAQSPALAGWGFTKAYALPPDCLIVRETSLEDDAYVIEDRNLLTDGSSAAIRYTARVTDPSRWSPLFGTAYTDVLAARLAYGTKASENLAAGLEQKAALSLRKAQAVDGIEGKRKRQLLSDILVRNR